jgi:hypothetical protein
VHVGAYAYHAHDWQLELARFEDQSLYARGFPRDVNAPPPPADMEVVRFDPLTIRLPLGGRVYAAVTGGWLGTSQPLHCEACARGVGSVEVGTGAWVARAARSAQLAIDGRIVVEDRVSAGYHLVSADYTLRADAFTALTRTTATGEGRIVATGGAALGLDLPLAYDFGMSADVEAGRTYYARLDADPTPTPETAARAELRLVRRFQYIPK